MERPMSRADRYLLPETAYQTYSIAKPRDTMIKAVCEQVGCERWRHGWDSPIDESTDLGRAQADYIRRHSGRTFREMRAPGGLTVFRFESGQRCFEEHRTRPETYRVRDGDNRGNPTGKVRTHTRPEDWVEDFGLNSVRLKEQHERG